MANIIESWLGNPLFRRVLGFFTKRSDGERRFEKILERYAGKEVDLGIRDRASYLFVERILDSVVSGAGLELEKAKENLKQGYWRKGLASVLEGIAWRGPQKPFTSYCPFLVVWNFTNACNLNCKHCYQSADKPTPDELSTKETLDAVDEMADAGLAYVAMSGGEPLMRDDFFEVAERISERDMGFSLATNGTLLTEERVKKLEELNCLYIQVSIDGRPETHNDFRGTSAFERTMEGVRNAVDSDVTVGLAMTATKDNLEDVDWVIEKTEETGADIFMHYNFIPTGRGKDIAELDISPKEREELLKKLAKNSQKRDINLLSTAPQYGRVCAEGGLETTSLTHFDTVGQEGGMGERIKFLAEFVGGCGTGRLYWALQPNGDLTPCVFLPEKLGNIREDDFLEVWKTHPFLEKIRERSGFKGNCGTCEHRNICGGCRARAYGYFDDVQGPDPGCLKNGEYLQKNSPESPLTLAAE
ncbi:hypothetical protein AKJ40_02640 [candidate division MSBL1 archaeon SCGC-AAA259M10]|uniref:Radical SAM core domain-containing protein n=1 Tax=candidate division MSBL1 archaeon SCGC-AAA259M10 TaxID=1698270 RepID=A0A133UZP2_9EURY|nr:hypothetical protein AKJ40_02640 [candidate division MSBL1 archaeon SCGC-AAA259M10]